MTDFRLVYSAVGNTEERREFVIAATDERWALAGANEQIQQSDPGTAWDLESIREDNEA